MCSIIDNQFVVKCIDIIQRDRFWFFSVAEFNIFKFIGCYFIFCALIYKGNHAIVDKNDIIFSSLHSRSVLTAIDKSDCYSLFNSDTSSSVNKERISSHN